MGYTPTRTTPTLKDPTKSLQNWTKSTFANPCSGLTSYLQGATCNNGRIYKLFLTNLSFHDSITPFLANCTNLQTYDLSSNFLAGPIPQQLDLFPAPPVVLLKVVEVSSEIEVVEDKVQTSDRESTSANSANNNGEDSRDWGRESAKRRAHGSWVRGSGEASEIGEGENCSISEIDGLGYYALQWSTLFLVEHDYINFRLELILRLGKGGFAYVFLVKKVVADSSASSGGGLAKKFKDHSHVSDDGTYAMKKVLIQNSEQLELVNEEIRVSSLFSHPNLFPLLDHAIIAVKTTQEQSRNESLPSLPLSAICQKRKEERKARNKHAKARGHYSKLGSAFKNFISVHHLVEKEESKKQRHSGKQKEKEKRKRKMRSDAKAKAEKK
ncbi:hypothetical protein FF2_033199 [Malus domestica]